jgi:hypothetical protein
MELQISMMMPWKLQRLCTMQSACQDAAYGRHRRLQVNTLVAYVDPRECLVYIGLYYEQNLRNRILETWRLF